MPCLERRITSGLGMVILEMLAKSISLIISVGLLGATLLALAACGGPQADGKLFFIEPRDGAQVKSPFTVKMGAADLVIEPASEDGVYRPGHGHHHIIVDSELPSLDQPIPSGSLQHLHFGKGQVETTLDLGPGEHTLRLLFAKGDHVPWSAPHSDSIKVTVLR